MDSISINKRCIDNIKYYRLKNGITQAKMAETLDVTEKHYCHLENLKYQLTIKNLEIISHVLNKEPWELLKEKHTKDDIAFLNHKSRRA